jgi:phenylacetate 2-hydroxylase
MPSPIIGVAILSILYVFWKYLYNTDIPKIKGIPEIPGWPLFGSLIELGEYHAKVAQDWSKKYGPVFQVRLGNRVRAFFTSLNLSTRLG